MPCMNRLVLVAAGLMMSACMVRTGGAPRQSAMPPPPPADHQGHTHAPPPANDPPPVAPQPTPLPEPAPQPAALQPMAPIRCSGQQALEAVGVRIDGPDAITASGQCVVTVRGSELNGRITLSGQAKVHIEDSSVQAVTMSGQAKLHSRGTRYSSAPQRSGQARIEDLGRNSW
jgi:hypothetical protein